MRARVGSSRVLKTEDEMIMLELKKGYLENIWNMEASKKVGGGW